MKPLEGPVSIFNSLSLHTHAKAYQFYYTERLKAARVPRRVWEGEVEAKVTEREARRETGEGVIEASEAVKEAEGER